MGGAVIDGLLGVVELEEAELHAGCEAIAAADAVEDLEGFILAGFMEFPVVPEDGGPVVDGGGDDAAQGGGGDLEVGKLLHCGLDPAFEGLGFDFRAVVVHALDLESERGGEVLFVADHDIDVFGDFAVHLAGLVEAADGFPE